MDSLKKELQEKLDKILHVFLFAKDAYNYTEYFHNPETEEESSFINNSPYSRQIEFIMHLMFRSLIVEISKLFSNSENDKFRIEKFLNTLSSSGHFRKIGINEKKVNEWLNQIIDNQKVIDDVLLLRSKVYAHTDNPLTNYQELNISFKKIKKLLDLAEEILISIYLEVFDNKLITQSPTFDRQRFGVLKLLVKGESQRIAEIYKKYYPSTS